MSNDNLQKTRKMASYLMLGIGALCLIIGLVFPLPGEHLTTYSSLANDAGSFYIEEYVGGDAYNYIIGASVLAGHIAGAMMTKSLFIVTGLLLLCAGCLALAFLADKKKQDDGIRPVLPEL